MLENVPFDDVSDDLIDDEKLSYMITSETENDKSELMRETSGNIKRLISEDREKKLNENEILVGKAIVGIMNNWEELFSNLGSNKFNKSSILLYLKEVTNLPTKEITRAMRKYKAVYGKTKKSLL